MSIPSSCISVFNISVPDGYVNITITKLAYNGYNDGICTYGGIALYEFDTFELLINESEPKSYVQCRNISQSSSISRVSQLVNVLMVIYLYPIGKDNFNLDLQLVIGKTRCQGFTLNLIYNKPKELCNNWKINLTSAILSCTKYTTLVNRIYIMERVSIELRYNQCLHFQLGNKFFHRINAFRTSYKFKRKIWISLQGKGNILIQSRMTFFASVDPYNDLYKTKTGVRKFHRPSKYSTESAKFCEYW